MFLMIRNKGETPIESFTILGVSSSRGKTAKIGQFGSGLKLGITCLLRHNVNPTIFIGKSQVMFYSQPATFKETTTYNKMFYRYKGKTNELGFSQEHGALDWNDVGMGLREFISNAIDEVGADNVEIKIVPKPSGKADYTTIYVPLTPEVQKYYNEINHRFLAFSGVTDKILPKKEVSQSYIYRKGVLIRQVNTDSKPALFNYNFGEELYIDESRNLNDYYAQTAAAKALCLDESSTEKVLHSVIKGENTWESELPKHYFDFTFDIVALWNRLTDNAVISTGTLLDEVAIKKGFPVKVINENWYEILKLARVKTVFDVISKVESNGCVDTNVSENARQSLKTVWNWLEKVNMTGSKTLPELQCFSKVMDGEEVLCGYYQDNIVYINVDNDSSLETMLEELTHYITGSTDMSRDFQDFAIKFAVRMAASTPEYRN